VLCAHGQNLTIMIECIYRGVLTKVSLEVIGVRVDRIPFSFAEKL